MTDAPLPFELAMVLLHRRHLLLKARGRSLLPEAAAAAVGSVAAKILRHAFVEPAEAAAAMRAVEPLDLPYAAAWMTAARNIHGNRAAVRGAFVMGDRALLVWCAASPEMRRYIRTSLPFGLSTEEVGGSEFAFAPCGRTEVGALLARRWDVRGDSPAAEDPPEVVGLDPRLFPYQREGVRMLAAGFRLLADEQGLGKTAQALAFARLSGCRTLVVCCPASVKLNWAREVVAWTDFAADDIQLLGGRTGLLLEHGKRVFIVNYDILRAWQEALSILRPDLIIADECQYIQNPAAARTKAFLAIRAKDRLFLSGTPFNSRPYQLFTALHAVAPKVFGSEYDFGMLFCGPKKGWGGRIEFKGASNLPLLNRILSDGICVRRLKADVMDDLPDRMRCVVPVSLDMELDAASRREAAELRERIRESSGAFGALEYERQLAYVRKRGAVVEWIADFLASCDRKLVVFVYHKRAMDDLAERFGGMAVSLGGGTPAAARQDAVDRFQTDPGVRLFIGQLEAAGVGITLTAACDTATIEFGLLASQHLQADDRVYRIGQHRAVKNYYLVAPGTVEERLAAIINRKAAIHKAIFDGADPVESEDNLLRIVWRERQEAARKAAGGKAERYAAETV